jgi:chromosome segregation ATPase
MAESEQAELRLPLQEPESSPVAPDPAKAIVECKGIRSTSDFPADLSALSREQIEHHYLAMRNSHASLTRSRGQLQRRSRELTVARDRFLETLRGYEGRLMALGQEKAEALRIAQDMHRELEAFEDKQQALDGVLKELDAAKAEAGYWSIVNITRLIERMRRLLRGGSGGGSES